MSTSAAPAPGGSERHDLTARRVDEACDRFESAWRSGLRPRIEDLVVGVDASERTALLGELLALELELRRRAGERPDPASYRSRFPGDARVVDAAFADAGIAPVRTVGNGAEPDPPRRQKTPSPGEPDSTDRGLLLGLLAFQNDFINRDQLLSAFAGWVADKSRPLGRLLLDSGAVDPETHSLLEALVRRHLDLHQGDPALSLAALSTIGSVRTDLSELTDTDLHASLARVSTDHTSREGDPAADRPVTSGGRFRIIRLHDRGGLGEVYLARDEEVKREVALKQIQARYSDDPQSRSRFLIEAEITGGLEHPGIVPIYGLGTDEAGRPFYAMRFIKGDSLKTAIRLYHEGGGGAGPTRTVGERSLMLRELLERFIDACDAIAYAHSRGVLHRDIKPANILLGPYGETLVVDWGLAKVVGRPESSEISAEATLRPESGSGLSATMPGAPLGTPAYMSPEQAAGEIDRLGPASDVYSLGATLYHILTGQSPMTGTDWNVLRAKLARGDFPAPRQVNREIPAALEAVCLHSMALLPEHRYPTPLALSDDVKHWLADEPVLALREGPVGRISRWSRRHRAWVLAGAAALGLVAVVSAAALVQSENQKRVIRGDRELLRVERDKAVVLLKKVRRSEAEWALHQSTRLLDQGLAGQALWWAASALDSADGEPEVLREARARLDLAARRNHALRACVSVPGRPRSVALSPDGLVAIVGGSEGEARLFDPADGRPVGAPIRHPGEVVATAFSPDGRVVLTGGTDGYARRWDAATGASAGPPLELGGPVTLVRFNPEGDRIVLAGRPNRARLFDAKTGLQTGADLEHEPADGWLNAIRSAEFTRDGKTLMTSSGGGDVRLWDASTGSPRSAPICTDSPLFAAAISPDGGTVITGCGEGHLRRWRTADGTEIVPSERPGDAVLAVAFSRNGDRIAAACGNGRAFTWNVSPAGLVQAAKVQHGEQVSHLAFSPAGEWLLTGGPDGTARLWDAANGRALGGAMASPGEITSVEFGDGGRRILTTANDGSARSWAVATSWAHRPTIPHAETVWNVSVDGSGSLALVGGSGNENRAWDLATGRPVGPALDQHGVSASAFSPDGRTLLLGSPGGLARAWNFRTGAPVSGHDFGGRPVRAVGFRDGLALAAVMDQHRSATVFDLTGNRLTPELRGPDYLIDLTLSADTSTLLAFGLDTAFAFDARSGDPIGPPFKGHGRVTVASLAGDGSLALVGYQDGTARFWDVRARRQLGATLDHDQPVCAASFSAANVLAATADHGGLVRIWDVRSGLPVGLPITLARPAVSLAFLPDGRGLAAAMEDRVTVVDVPVTAERDPQTLSERARRATGLTWERGEFRPVSRAEWDRSRRDLDESGAPAAR